MKLNFWPHKQKDFETPKKRTKSITPESPPIATIKQPDTASKYSRVPILPGAVYDVYPLQLQSIDSFIFAQRTKLNSIFSQSLDSDLADYCHKQKPLLQSEISAGDAVAINDKDMATWRRAEIVWVDATMVKVRHDFSQYLLISVSTIESCPCKLNFVSGNSLQTRSFIFNSACTIIFEFYPQPSKVDIQITIKHYN